MATYNLLVITTKYWKPKENIIKEITNGIEQKIADRDFVVVSEKAVSVALGNIVDERVLEPSFSAKLLANLWMRICWGHFLSWLCHFRKKMIKYLREYPLEEGSRHKQLILQQAGLLQALMFGSEGGIDGTNLPFSYVSLPLKTAYEITEKIRAHTYSRTGKKVFVMITDTDKTYTFRNFHFTPRPYVMKGIYSSGGVFAYLVGRIFRLKKRATPLAIAGCNLPIETALDIAEMANHARGAGAGRTVWEMAEKFKVDLVNVTWEMLETVKHKPIVIVRNRR